MTKHEALFMAHEYTKKFVYKPKYYCWHSHSSYDNPDVEYVIEEVANKFVSNSLVWSGEIEAPHLKEGETIFLHAFEKEVKVLKVTRSTDDSVIYQTNFKFDYIEDEHTEKSLLQAEQAKQKREEMLKNDWKMEEKEPEVKENWWQKLISKIKS